MLTHQALFQASATEKYQTINLASMPPHPHMIWHHRLRDRLLPCNLKWDQFNLTGLILWQVTHTPCMQFDSSLKRKIRAADWLYVKENKGENKNMVQIPAIACTIM
jgi:hypothetical protein